MVSISNSFRFREADLNVIGSLHFLLPLFESSFGREYTLGEPCEIYITTQSRLVQNYRYVISLSAYVFLWIKRAIGINLYSSCRMSCAIMYYGSIVSTRSIPMCAYHGTKRLHVLHSLGVLLSTQL